MGASRRRAMVPPPPPLRSRALVLALVFGGGVLGAASRDAVEQALPSRAGSLPLATLAVNLAGAYLLGLLVEVLARRAGSMAARRLRLLAGTGFLGAFTTYSTFVVEADELVRGGHGGLAAAYVTVSAVGGLAATAAGILTGALPARARPEPLPVDPDVDTGPPARHGGRVEHR